MSESRSSIYVSIVEDNADVRDSLKILINGSPGFSCTQVYGTAEGAIEKPPPLETDIVLMDVHLPGKSGIECITILKDKIPQTQFMMFTVFDDDEHIFSALSAGATGYILKRTSPVQILDALRELYDGGAPMSSSIARKVVASYSKEKKTKAAFLLTPRELEILDLLAKGQLYKEIADELDVTTGTIKKHLHNVYEKLHVKNRTEAVNKVFKSV